MANEKPSWLRRVAYMSPRAEYCPSVYETSRNSYFIVGKQVNPEKAGLGKAVGEGEVLIEVPKGLLTQMKKK